MLKCGRQGWRQPRTSRERGVKRWGLRRREASPEKLEEGELKSVKGPRGRAGYQDQAADGQEKDARKKVNGDRVRAEAAGAQRSK